MKTMDIFYGYIHSSFGGKSSLLFQFAFNSAIHVNSTTSTSSSTSAVVFLCNRRKYGPNPPFLSQGIDPCSQVFQRIKMKNCQEKHSNPRGRDLAMVRVLALCQNAITHANAAGVAFSIKSRQFLIFPRDGFGSFLVKNSYHFGSAAKKLAKYSVAVEHLVLEGITEDDGQRKNCGCMWRVTKPADV